MEKFIDFIEEKDVVFVVSWEINGIFCFVFFECLGVVGVYEFVLLCLDYFGVLVCVGILLLMVKVLFYFF